MQIAIIDCGAGNLHSVRKAFASQLADGATLEIVTEPNILAKATHIVLPGVGAFADCMQGLNNLPGMRDALEDAVLKRETPFFGICVGMQMLFERGYEYGEHAGLGWLKGEVRKIEPRDPSLKIPHMGWDRLQLHDASNSVLNGIAENDYAYFVHSFAATDCDPKEILATVDYGGAIVALVERKNIVASQFHPEKSQAVGLRMIKNFLGR